MGGRRSGNPESPTDTGDGEFGTDACWVSVTGSNTLGIKTKTESERYRLSQSRMLYGALPLAMRDRESP